jgi:glycosyltransferase involved in cell wall biosynthesis
MKVLHISTYDTTAGAGRATYRLQKSLLKVGVDSQMLVKNKASDDRTVISAAESKIEKLLSRLSHSIDLLPLQCYRQRKLEMFSPQWFPDRVTPRVVQLEPDIINLHGICNGYLRIETIVKFNKPLVWTLHDMWAFTGGCHYSKDCDRYTASCGACPHLHSSNDWDLSRWVWQRKAKAWKDLNLTLVTPSTWLAKCASSSYLFNKLQVEVIPNGLDTRKYKPINRQVVRELLNLPQNKQIVLFGATRATTDSRKGYPLLQLALQKLGQSGWKEKIELIVFGASQAENPVDLGLKSHYIGKLHDDISLAALYSAADVMLVPSTQEAFGQTATESLACGTPVVSFDSTGLKDIVEHQRNGYRAKCFSCDDLANGIAWVLENKERHQKLSHRAREKVEQEFTMEIQARRYLSLYTEILDNKLSPKQARQEVTA